MTLADFGGGFAVDEPTFTPHAPVYADRGAKRDTIGHRGAVPQRDPPVGFAARYKWGTLPDGEDGEQYAALPTRVLAQLARHGIEWIFIVDDDHGGDSQPMIYEYRPDQFTRTIPAEFSPRPTLGEHRAASVASALYEWEIEVGEFYELPEGSA